MQDAQQATEAFTAYALDLIATLRASSVPLSEFLDAHLPQYYSRLDQTLEAFNRHAPAPIACRPNCAACCSFLVVVSPIEAVYIWRQMRKKRPQEQVVSFTRAIAERARVQDEMQRRGLDHARMAEEYKRKKIPCQFLTANQACAIHPYRPFICRNHNVVSEPELCYDLENMARVKVWRHPSLWKLDLACQKEFSKIYLNGDEPGLMQPMMMKYEGFNVPH